jgi:uncharacterized protein (DUF362 family)
MHGCPRHACQRLFLYPRHRRVLITRTRRELLRDLALGLGGLSLGGVGLPACGRPEAPAEVTAATGWNDLAVVSGGDAGTMVRRAIASLGGIRRFVTRGAIVTLKPNFYMGQPAAFATTTDPAVVRAVCEECLAAGARRIVMLDKCARKTVFDDDALGIEAMLGDLQHTYYALLSEGRLYRDLELGRRFELGRIGVARQAYECDVLINVPVAKSHNATGVTFGIKNLMGLVEKPELWHSEQDLHRAIADFGEHLRPALTVVDATRGLLTGGPGWGGEVGDLKTIVAGVDPVAVDACTLGLSPWNGRRYEPSEVAYLKHAAELGAGTLDWKSLTHEVVSL